jgi:hypothetical protein
MKNFGKWRIESALSNSRKTEYFYVCAPYQGTKEGIRFKSRFEAEREMPRIKLEYEENLQLQKEQIQMEVNFIEKCLSLPSVDLSKEDVEEIINDSDPLTFTEEDEDTSHTWQTNFYSEIPESIKNRYPTAKLIKITRMSCWKWEEEATIDGTIYFGEITPSEDM